MTQEASAISDSRPAWPVACNILAIGVCCGIIQVVLIRQLLAVCSGSELTVGIILGVWLFSGALGCWWAGRQAKADSDITRTGARVALLACFGLLASLSAIALIRVSPELFLRLPGIFAAQRGEMFGLVQILSLTFLATFPAAFIVEAQFGAAISLYATLRRDSSVIARSYAVDAAGHLVGGSAAAYFLTTRLDPYTAVAAAGLVALFSALVLWTLLLPARRAAVARLCTIAVILLAAPAVQAAGALDDYTLSVRWRGYELLANVDTLQSNIVVARHGKAGKVFFISGQPAAYTETMPDIQLLVHFTMLQHPNPRRVMLVGGLGVGAIEEVTKYDLERVDYFELDPGLLRIYADYRGVLPAGKVHIWRHDLRTYLRSTSRDPDATGWDVAIIALPPPLTALVNRYYTRECFEQIVARSPDTVIGLQLPGTQTYYSADLLRLNTTLLAAPAIGPAKRVVLMPGYNLYAAIGPDSDYMTEAPDEMLRRLAERNVSAPFWESVIYDRLEPMNIAFVRDQLDKFPASPLNTDLRPIAYFYNQIYAMRQFHQFAAKLLQAAAGLPWSLILSATIAASLLLVGLVGVFRSLRRFAVPVAIAGTGFIGMVLQLAVLYAFQVYVGHIYSLIGVLSGAFMVGLAAGGLFAGRLVGRNATAQAALRNLCLALVILAATGFAFTLIIRAITAIAPAGSTWSLAGAFFAISMFLGALVGVQFPLATEAAGEPQERGPVAAAMYAADLLGASSGAVIAGALLVPLFGIIGASILCGILACGLLAVCMVRMFDVS